MVRTPLSAKACSGYNSGGLGYQGCGKSNGNGNCNSNCNGRGRGRPRHTS